MDPPVKPEGDSGWVAVAFRQTQDRIVGRPKKRPSFAGLTGESIHQQPSPGEMDPPVKPEGDGMYGWLPPFDTLRTNRFLVGPITIQQSGS